MIFDAFYFFYGEFWEAFELVSFAEGSFSLGVLSSDGLADGSHILIVLSEFSRKSSPFATNVSSSGSSSGSGGCVIVSTAPIILTN